MVQIKKKKVSFDLNSVTSETSDLVLKGSKTITKFELHIMYILSYTLYNLSYKACPNRKSKLRFGLIDLRNLRLGPQRLQNHYQI